MARYPQLCAVARAAEILGERWTLLIIRELLIGPRRFTALKEQLDPITSSVLSDRLRSLETAGIIGKAGSARGRSASFVLTGDGEALRPAIYALIRWGSRRLFPVRDDDAFDPEWLTLVFAAYARRGVVPQRVFEISIGSGSPIYVVGTPTGTTLALEAPAPGLAIGCSPIEALGLMSGRLPAAAAAALVTHGDPALIAQLPLMFDLETDG